MWSRRTRLRIHGLGLEIDSEHLLRHHLAEKYPQNIPNGSLIGAALDGDGDRCLLIEATESGARVMDGDEMADNIQSMGFHGSDNATMAFSIETDLSLTSSDRFRMQVNFLECAVGDRWLSNQLCNDWIDSKNWPSITGAEDSGHLVMASPHPEIENKMELGRRWGCNSYLSTTSACITI